MESSMILLAGFLYLSLKLLLYIFNAIHYTGMLFTNTYFPKPYQFLTWQMAKHKIYNLSISTAISTCRELHCVISYSK